MAKVTLECTVDALVVGESANDGIELDKKFAEVESFDS